MIAEAQEKAWRRAQNVSGERFQKLEASRLEAMRLALTVGTAENVLEDARLALSQAEQTFEEAKVTESAAYATFISTKRRGEFITEVLNGAVPAALFAFIFPLIGAIVQTGSWLQFGPLAVFYGFSIFCLMRVAEPVGMLIGARYQATMVFVIYAALMLLVPVAVLMGGWYIGAFVIANIADFVIACAATLVATWFVPSAVEKVI